MAATPHKRTAVSWRHQCGINHDPDLADERFQLALWFCPHDRHWSATLYRSTHETSDGTVEFFTFGPFDTALDVENWVYEVFADFTALASEPSTF